MVKSKSIIEDHLIPQVSSLYIRKDMLDTMTILYEGKNINRKMTLRTQLNGVKMQKARKAYNLASKGSLKLKNN